MRADDHKARGHFFFSVGSLPASYSVLFLLFPRCDGFSLEAHLIPPSRGERARLETDTFNFDFASHQPVLVQFPSFGLFIAPRLLLLIRFLRLALLPSFPPRLWLQLQSRAPESRR
jgi:hypothetical protein